MSAVRLACPAVRKIFLIVLVVLGLGLAACGSGGKTAETPKAPETSQASAVSEQPSNSELPTRKLKAVKPDKAVLVGPQPKPAVPKGAPPKALVIKPLIEGGGAVAQKGDKVSIQYVGAAYKTKGIYDSSWSWGNPYVFTLGAEEVIPGLEQGVEGMAVGDRRELVIPPALADPDGSYGGIPDKETVVYVVDLLSVE